MKKLSICLLALLLTLCGQAALAAVPLETPVVEADIMPAPMGMDIAPASGDMSAELAKVTQSVKTALDIGDEYTEFYGNQSSDRLFVSWDLYWSNDEEQLNVTADGKGRVISYSRYDNQGRRYNYYGEFAPIFPKQGREDALAIARAFLARVLDKNEEMIFEDLKAAPQPVRTEQSYYFYGSLKANGLPTPLYISISVDMDNMRVSSFNREVMERQYLGGLPGSTPKVSVGEAAPKLSETVGVEAAYYLDDTGKQATLQYRPVRRSATGVSVEAQISFYTDSRNVFYVDALTGELIDMEKLYKEAQEAAGDFYGNTRANAPAMAMAEDAKAIGGGGDGGTAPRALTEAELAGTAEQSGLLSGKDMDAKLRAMTELGLTGNFKLSRINYGRDGGDKPAYYAYLSYFAETDAASLGLSEAELKKLRDAGNKYYTYKDFSLNAQTGEIRSISTYGSYIDPAITTLKQGDYSEQAIAFLTKYFGEYYKQSKPGGGWAYGVGDGDPHYFSFSRQVNNYSFPENNLQVRVNPYTGIIEDFNFTWDKELTFAPADNIISAEQAKQVYLSTLDCKLCYKQLPVAIDRSKPEFEPYISYGVTYLYKMGLVYAYEPKGETALGVDAVSGEALYYESYSRELFEYDDIAGHAAEGKIKELAAFGVGFGGGKFMPAAKLTELDMILFFLSAQGNSYDPAELPEEKIESIYMDAYYMGILEPGYEIKPQREISRGEYLKTIVRSSGYGKTALIPNIFTCDFSDAQDIPADLYGYAAIAQGLGMLGRGGSLKPAEIIDRAEAAVIFHNFMSREY